MHFHIGRPVSSSFWTLSGYVPNYCTLDILWAMTENLMKSSAQCRIKIEKSHEKLGRIIIISLF